MIPIGDSPRRYTTPWVNYALILANIAVFLFMLTLSTQVGTRREFIDQTNGVCYGFQTAPTQIDHFYCEWGFQPEEWFDTAAGNVKFPGQSTALVIITIITSMFIHGGWVHIIGNMLFLWVFGDNVEDRFGHLRYLGFYILSGIIAALLQGAINSNSVVPVIGASGAIAGTLGAYFLMYPKAHVNIIIPFFILIFIPIPVPAILLIGIWFLQNLGYGLATIGNPDTAAGGVAFFAHIGGFLFGVLVALIFRPKPRTPWQRYRKGS